LQAGEATGRAVAVANEAFGECYTNIG
jgi:hypothetical protein